MKTAKEMKQKTLQNCVIVKYLEEVVAPLIEASAAKGETYIEIETDKISRSLSRYGVYDRVREYLGDFGYCVSATSNQKKITIDWNVR